MSSAAHKQVLVKVNAQCDEGIAPLVIALNAVPGVITLDSCQRLFEGKGHVFFTYGDSWETLAPLLAELAYKLSHLNMCCEYILSMEWLGSNDQPHARLLVDPEHVEAIATAIQDYAGSLTAVSPSQVMA